MKEQGRAATTAQRLKEAMASAGMSQAALARAADINRGTISRYTTGEIEPKAAAIHKLAVALNVSEMWLWGHDVPKGRTEGQKKNDDLVKVIAQLRRDPDFYEVVSLLAQLSPAEYASVKQLLAVLVKK